MTSEVRGQVFTNEIFARWLVESDTNVDVKYKRKREKEEKKLKFLIFLWDRVCALVQNWGVDSELCVKNQAAG